jgi:hypothetical protein
MCAFLDDVGCRWNSRLQPKQGSSQAKRIKPNKPSQATSQVKPTLWQAKPKVMV